MAAQSLMDYFSGPAMTKLADAPLIKRGLPFDLDPALQTPSSRKPVGINFMYEAYNGVRNSGRITAYDSPPVGIEVTGSQKQFGTCLGGRESFIIPDELILGLKSNIPFVAGNAMDEFLRRMRNYRTRADSRRINMISSAFLRGKISWVPNNATGGTVALPTSTVSGLITVDFAPTVLVVGNTIPNSGGATVPDFSTSTTDIPGFFRTLKKAFRFTSNYDATNVCYDMNIPGYMGSTNTSMQAYWSRNQRYGSAFMDTNEVPTGCFDFKWRPGYKQYFIDENTGNAITPWLAADTIVVTPDISEDWYENVDGSCKVPVGMPPVVSSGDIDALLAGFEYKWGISGYSLMDANTLALRALMQDFSLPTLKNGLVQWIIKVKA